MPKKVVNSPLSSGPRKGVRIRLIVGTVTTVFLSVWAFVLVLSGYHAHQKFSDIHHHGGGAGPADKVRKLSHAAQLHPQSKGSISVSIETNPVQKPHYGWQPLTKANTDTPWEQCMNPGPNNLQTCRQEPIGPAPPVKGNWIPDVTVLHRMFLQGKDAKGNPFPPKIGGNICKDFWKGNDINKRLFQRSTVSPKTTLTSPKIFCGVYTMASAHHLTIRAMRETWAPRCDGFLAFSTESDPRIPAMAISHEGPEEYNNMWQKSRAIWKFIGDHYLEDFDYFFMGGEDLFVIVDNLRAYLASLPTGPEDDHFVGRRFKGYGKNNYFNSGGAGYALSRGTLRKYIREGYENTKECEAHTHSSMEDVFMAQCLRRLFKIGLTDTRDDKGRERFHPFAPGIHLVRKEQERDWYYEYNKEWGIKYGPDCCAPDSVSFHYIKKPTMVRHLHGLLYECGDLSLQ